MRKNLYVTCGDLKKYDGWEVIQVIPKAVNNADYCMAVITKDEKPIQKEPYLSEATNEELIKELNKRLEAQYVNITN